MKTIKSYDIFLFEYIKNVDNSKWTLNKIKDEIAKKWNIINYVLYNGGDSICIYFEDYSAKKSFETNTKFRKHLNKKFNTPDKTILYNEISGFTNDRNCIDYTIKDLYFNRVKPPQFVYHVTEKGYRNSILKNGLIPNTNKIDYGMYNYDKPFIFASSNPKQLFWNNNESDVWIIDTTKIQNKWFVDFNYPKEKNHIMTDTPIPSLALKRMSYNAINKKYSSKLSENIKNDYYSLFGELVSIDNIYRWGDEIKVEYIKSDGSKHTYIGDDKDFKEDFIETSDKFEFLPAKKIDKIIPIKKENKYDLVFYIGSKKIETLERNLNSELAFALKNKYSKEPKYKIGIIKAEKI